MPGIGGAIIGLRLAAQHRLHHERLFRLVGNVLEHPVEQARRHHLPQRQFLAHRGEVIPQGNQLFAARRFVNAVNHGGGLGLQRLGRGDIGGDHEIFHHAVRVEPFADRDFGDLALFVQHHAPFGQFEFERIAGMARGGQRFPCVPQMREICRRVAAINRLLRVFVSDIVRNPYQRAGEAEACNLAFAADVQVADHRRAVFAFFQ